MTVRMRSVSKLFKSIFAATLFVLLPHLVLAESTKITFLHTNDMGEISGKRGYGGFPELATLIAKERQRSNGAITTFGGDLISPSLMSGLSHGVEMVDMLNALKVDIAVLGNHEFDFGPGVTRERIAQSQFSWLASNVSVTGGEAKLGTKTIYIKDVGGYKIGFFGTVTPETTSLSSPGVNIKFEDVVVAAKRAMTELKKQGAEVFIAITHMDLADDIRLAKEVSGLNAILGGHDHRTFASVENGVVILQAGSDLRYLGVLDLDVERKEKRGKKYLSIIPSWKILATSNVKPDMQISEMTKKFEKVLDKKLDVEVGKTHVALDTRRTSVRTKQTIFGKFVARAMKEEVGADVGFTNGGGIRGDREYEAGSILTRKDILRELPFGNVTVLVEVSGENIVKLLEHSVSKVEDGAGRFGHFVGVSFDFNAKNAVGNRVSNVKVAGKTIGQAKVYTLATNDYVAGGGDGFAMLKTSKHVIDKAAGTLMATTVMNSIKEKGGISAVK
ncbi:MAG: bifunctional metallophosphatase/5'-nucleotidase [Sneathiella sp.]|nr:bifunctional metallophosphatase/5'-nucleotidase [Sneathiella sp.]